MFVVIGEKVDRKIVGGSSWKDGNAYCGDVECRYDWSLI